MTTLTADDKARSYTGKVFSLELDEPGGSTECVDYLRSIDGGGIKTAVLDSREGHYLELRRQLGRTEYEDITLQVGMAASETFYAWIADFFDGTVVRKNGAIVAGDPDYNERARRTIREVLIREVTIPALDANDTKPCYMSVKLVPEMVIFEKPDQGTDMHRPPRAPAQKEWQPGNFRFSFDTFGHDLLEVTKIDAFTIKQQIMEYRHGASRGVQLVPGVIEIPNLTFYLRESAAKNLIKHVSGTVIDGKAQPEPRLAGSIEVFGYGDNNDKIDLCTITLSGIDLVSATPSRSDASSDDTKQVKVVITVERMQFKYHGFDPLSF